MRDVANRARHDKFRQPADQRRPAEFDASTHQAPRVARKQHTQKPTRNRTLGQAVLCLSAGFGLGRKLRGPVLGR